MRLICFCPALFLAGISVVPAVAQDAGQTVKSALTRCFTEAHARIPMRSDRKDIPPGLIEGQDVKIAPLPSTGGNAFYYEGAGAGISCGIAMYGAVRGSLLMEIKELIDGYPSRWKPNSPDFYKLSGVSGDETYWGDPLAPGLIGVVMLVRAPNPNTPTVEVEYHSSLLR